MNATHSPKVKRCCWVHDCEMSHQRKHYIASVIYFILCARPTPSHTTVSPVNFCIKKLMHDAMCHNLFYLETAFTIYPHEMVKREAPLGNLGSFHFDRSKLGKSFDCKTHKIGRNNQVIENLRTPWAVPLVLFKHIEFLCCYKSVW